MLQKLHEHSLPVVLFLSSHPGRDFAPVEGDMEPVKGCWEGHGNCAS